jgi:hypothetical protein
MGENPKDTPPILKNIPAPKIEECALPGKVV